MKVKSPHETAGPFGKHHQHLGHFTKKEHINRGHNEGPRIAGKWSGEKLREVTSEEAGLNELRMINEEIDQGKREAANEVKREGSRGGYVLSKERMRARQEQMDKEDYENRSK